MSTFLQLDRKRLGLSAHQVVDKVGTSRASYTRWEAGGAIPSDKLALLAKLGFDVQYVITGVRSNNVSEISNKPQRKHFDFEGKLTKIICILEDALNEHDLELPSKAKGQVIEGLLMQALVRNEQPTKENIMPFLKVVGL